MTRIEWQELARVICARREEIQRKWSDGKPGAYERQLARGFQLAALDDTARAMAKWLKSRSSRFDEARFLTLAGVRS